MPLHWWKGAIMAVGGNGGGGDGGGSNGGSRPRNIRGMLLGGTAAGQGAPRHAHAANAGHASAGGHSQDDDPLPFAGTVLPGLDAEGTDMLSMIIATHRRLGRAGRGGFTRIAVQMMHMAYMVESEPAAARMAGELDGMRGSRFACADMTLADGRAVLDLPDDELRAFLARAAAT